MKKPATPPKQLRRFDYTLVAAPLEGVLINVDRDLQRRVKIANAVQDQRGELSIGMLNIMQRFAVNSYHAVAYLVGDLPEDPRRKKNFVLAVPAINRQLLDLLFSLVYMLDDFPARSLEYQRSGWRELRDEYQHWKTYFSTDSEWKPFLDGLKFLLEQWEGPSRITEEEKKEWGLIPYWKTPTQLKDQPTKSRPFLRYLDTWIYRDVSAQAHLSFGGLMKATPMLVAELVGGQHEEEVEDRIVPQYHFLQVSRTAFITLAIATEIDVFLALGNGEQILMLWNIFGEYCPEAKEMYENRYRGMLEKGALDGRPPSEDKD